MRRYGPPLANPDDDLLIVKAEAVELQELEEEMTQLKAAWNGLNSQDGRGGRRLVNPVWPNSSKIDLTREGIAVQLKVGHDLDKSMRIREGLRDGTRTMRTRA